MGYYSSVFVKVNRKKLSKIQNNDFDIMLEELKKEEEYEAPEDIYILGDIQHFSYNSVKLYNTYMSNTMKYINNFLNTIPEESYIMTIEGEDDNDFEYFGSLEEINRVFNFEEIWPINNKKAEKILNKFNDPKTSMLYGMLFYISENETNYSYEKLIKKSKKFLENIEYVKYDDFILFYTKDPELLSFSNKDINSTKIVFYVEGNKKYFEERTIDCVNVYLILKKGSD